MGFIFSILFFGFSCYGCPWGKMTFKEFFARFRVIVVSKDKNNFPKHTLSPSRSKFRSNGEYLSIVTISSQMSICDVWRELNSTYHVTMRRSSSCSNYAPSFDLYVVIKLAFRTESIKGHIVMKSVTPSPEWGRELRSHWASIHVLGARNLLYMFVSCNTDHPGHGRRLSSVTQHHLSENASVDNDEDNEEIWFAERYVESS